jgi:predicted nucleic acid-binding Zn ribbon protein
MSGEQQKRRPRRRSEAATGPGSGPPRPAPEPDSPLRLRRPERLGDLLSDAARALGLDAEPRLGRAIATWDAIVAERVPPAVGACHLVRIEPGVLVVAADEPIVASELRMRALELLAAFSAAPAGAPVHELRLTRSTEGEHRSGRV